MVAGVPDIAIVAHIALFPDISIVPDIAMVPNLHYLQTSQCSLDRYLIREYLIDAPIDPLAYVYL